MRNTSSLSRHCEGRTRASLAESSLLPLSLDSLSLARPEQVQHWERARSSFRSLAQSKSSIGSELGVPLARSEFLWLARSPRASPASGASSEFLGCALRDGRTRGKDAEACGWCVGSSQGVSFFASMGLSVSLKEMPYFFSFCC